MNEITKAVIDIAREAGLFLKQFSDEHRDRLGVVNKHTDFDLVTNADRESQAMIRALVLERFPDHQFIGEEDELTNEQIKQRIADAPDTCFWIVDPLDGTVNYVHGFPGYGVSLAVVRGGESLSGAIYLPELGELYAAEKGSGAWLNGDPIHVSDCRALRHAMLATGLPVDDTKREHHLAWQSRLSLACMTLRMMGCAAQSQAYVACGRLDGYCERGPHPWDVSAGILLVREAGGEVRQCDGSPYEIGSDGVLAAAPGILSELAGFSY